MKRCTACGEVKPLDAFYRRRGGKDGRLNQCKACRSVTQAAWRRSAADARRVYMAKWKQDNPEKQAAHDKVKIEVRAGRMTRPDACEQCGGGGDIHGHHDDYDRPLDVRWLCRSCHAAVHHGEEDSHAA